MSTTPTRSGGPRANRDRPNNEPCRQAATPAPQTQADVFGEARERMTVMEAWRILRLPGEPCDDGKSCRSPFREDSTPSFSIYKGGRKWKDHGSGDGGDVVAFVCHALGAGSREARRWFLERLGIDHHDAPRSHEKRPEPRKAIQWPAELVTGDAATWEAFAAKKRVPFAAVQAAVRWGFLRFAKVDGLRCYAVTDTAGRSAEIRRCDGGAFRNGCKAYPLAGVDKAWPVGGDVLKSARMHHPVLICEGATDWLAGFGAYTRWKRERPFAVAHIDAEPHGTYIGRANPRRGLAGSPFGNPFRIGKDGDRDEVLAKYREHIGRHPELVEQAARELSGTVTCWCHPERCHGDVLADAILAARQSWIVLAFLGASCRKLHPELLPFMRGRLVRIVADGDPAGDKMGEHWRDLLLERGCTVKVVELPRGRDLRDMLESGELQPGELFA